MICSVKCVVDAYTHSIDTSQAVLYHASSDKRLVFSYGWHTTRDGKDVNPPSIDPAVAIDN